MNEGSKSTPCWILHKPQFESDVINPSLASSPWSGHRSFAYDLVAFLKPTRVVELGTHYGCSFFAFAQAIKDLGISSSLIAIDTWTGDPDAGYYGEEVFETFQRTIRQHFSGISTHLIRKSFDEALDDVEGNSVSLLHIDGLHNYEAVQHDFETWLDKLAVDAVVLFHDVAPSSNYGSATYWSEIRRDHPHFEFQDHSFGLGILFPKGSVWYNRAVDSGLGKWLEFYRYKSLAELFEMQLETANDIVRERWEIIEEMDGVISVRNQQIRELEEKIRAFEEESIVQATKRALRRLGAG